MDKYEFNLKMEQMKKLIHEEDYGTALKIVESIDWNRVRNINLLTMAATVYEKNDMLTEARDVLHLALDRAPVGKRILYKLAEIAVRMGSLDEAEDYYYEFRQTGCSWSWIIHRLLRSPLPPSAAPLLQFPMPRRSLRPQTGSAGR